jgi:hypothetical protein
MASGLKGRRGKKKERDKERERDGKSIFRCAEPDEGIWGDGAV